MKNIGSNMRANISMLKSRKFDDLKKINERKHIQIIFGGTKKNDKI